MKTTTTKPRAGDLHTQLTPAKLEELSKQSFTDNLSWVIDQVLEDAQYHREATSTFQDWQYWDGYCRAILDLYPLVLKLTQAEQLRRQRQRRDEDARRDAAFAHYLEEFRPRAKQ